MPDIILAFLLTVLVPAKALWRRPSKGITRQRRYVSTIFLIALLLVLLAHNWLTSGRPLAALGLDVPPAGFDLLLIGGALLMIIILAAAIFLNRSKATADSDPSGILPTTPHERRLFVMMSFATGVGWEILYRGFLLSFLTQQAGLLPAIAIATVSYALAHGAQGKVALFGSLISALLFTVAFAWSGSLWWLIVLHVGLPLATLLRGGVAGNSESKQTGCANSQT